MLREQHRALKRILIISDLSLIAIAFFIGYFLRGKVYDLNIGNVQKVFKLSFYMGLLPVLLLIWGGLLSYFGMYKSSGIRNIPDALYIVLETTVLGFVLFGSYIFIFRMQEDVSRLFMGFTFIIGAFLICSEKIFLRYLFVFLSKKGTNFKGVLIAFRSILVIGTGKRARKFLEIINRNPDWCIKVIGLVDINQEKIGEVISSYKVIGTFDDIPKIIHTNVVDEVVFIVPRAWLSKIETIMHFCEDEGLNVHLAVDLFELKFSKARQTDIGSFPLLTFESLHAEIEYVFIKRLFDFAISGIALLLLSPLFLFIAVAIKTTSQDSIFFKQERSSVYGRKFTFYKFRTMVVDAEARLNDLLKYNEMTGPVFKMTNDPRVTSIGKWLRKYSLDELPQLWNVFKGDMSLVGPRPPLLSEVEKYDNWQRRKLSMRPGITCLWQVSGRNEIADFNEWMKLDLEYIDNWSLWLDFKILLRTIPVVFFGKGAK